jgi:hypothetical protein
MKNMGLPQPFEGGREKGGGSVLLMKVFAGRGSECFL